jgi:hypothetical protein
MAGVVRGVRRGRSGRARRTWGPFPGGRPAGGRSGDERRSGRARRVGRTDGRWRPAEIVDAIAALAAAGTRPRRVDEAAIARHLYHPDMPDPDLVVRTSGERRVSDLLLWEVAYSELVVVDAPWPDVRRRDFYDAVVEYQQRDRRYGGLDPAADGGDLR